MRRLARLNPDRLAQLDDYVEYLLKAGTSVQHRIFTDDDHYFLRQIAEEHLPLPK